MAVPHADFSILRCVRDIKRCVRDGFVLVGKLEHQQMWLNLVNGN